jgi:hypothetical protein
MLGLTEMFSGNFVVLCVIVAKMQKLWQDEEVLVHLVVEVLTSILLCHWLHKHIAVSLFARRIAVSLVAQAYCCVIGCTSILLCHWLHKHIAVSLVAQAYCCVIGCTRIQLPAFLITNHEVPGSIPGSTMGIFPG